MVKSRDLGGYSLWGRQNNALPCQGAHNLIPRIYGYVTLHGKRDFADMINVRDLEGG